MKQARVEEPVATPIHLTHLFVLNKMAAVAAYIIIQEIHTRMIGIGPALAMMFLPIDPKEGQLNQENSVSKYKAVSNRIHEALELVLSKNHNLVAVIRSIDSSRTLDELKAVFQFHDVGYQICNGNLWLT